jgi:hypothetical protein
MFDLNWPTIMEMADTDNIDDIKKALFEWVNNYVEENEESVEAEYKKRNQALGIAYQMNDSDVILEMQESLREVEPIRNCLKKIKETTDIDEVVKIIQTILMKDK